FFFQAEDGIRDRTVTGVQTCALPIFEVSSDGGREWDALPGAALQVSPSPYGWVKFNVHYLLLPGLDEERSYIVRAIDAAGNEQPVAPRWNALGYANNAVRPTRIRVRS